MELPRELAQPQLGLLFTTLGYAVGAVAFYLSLRFPPRNAAPRPILSLYQRNVVLIAGLLGGVLGAKLTQFLALGWPFVLPAGSILNAAAGGRTILGGILCGWIAVEIAKWRLGIKRSLGAPFAIGLAAGEVLGRIGCLFNGCCFGAACGAPHPAWAIYQHGAWRWPVQLYSSAAALLLLLVLLWLRPRLARDGDLFYVYLLGFGLLRFGLEFLRGSEHSYFGLSLAQIVCLELIASGGIALCIGWLRRQRKTALAREAVDAEPST